MEFSHQMFGSGSFMPHGFCYLWNPGLVWLHVLADSVIALSYFAIPAVLLWLVRKRRDLPFNWMFVLFGVFIVACGSTHAMEIWTLWHADYWFSGAVKAVTAAASLTTAALLLRLAPQALALPNIGQWMSANATLQKEVRDHAQEERALRDTERRALDALRQSEARYRGLVDNATYGICWIKPNGKLLQVNPALARMLGCDSVEELLEVGDVKSLYCEPPAAETIRKEYEATGRAEATVEWRRKDARTITVRMNGRRVKDQERDEECIEVIVEDITQRLMLEKQLVQAQKFEAIGQLAGGIAHDFNNMIGAILGWADMGIEETGEGTRVRRHFEKMRQQAVRAAALTRQLLTFARRQILEPRDMDLNQSVIETLSLLEKVIGSNIEIKANLAPNLAIVRADPIQVDQVLMNLCINARDAMPEGGSLLVETTNVAIDEQFCALQPLAHPGSYALLSVADSGVGMDAATLDRIFEPFFTTKEPGKGTGLGLATVYGIVRQHGGFLDVSSEPGTGSTFRIYLPVSLKPVNASARVEEPQPIRGGSETILIAEDHEGLGQLAVETLTDLGYLVILATDGEQALREFQSHREQIDLAILDVVLPKLSGPEIYARIHSEEPGVPVVFATGYSPDFALLQRVQEERLPVLQKPYAPRDLARKVRETLDQRARQAAEDRG